MAFNVFIDTEFTDFLDPQLISIGLVAESGEEFYAELPYDIKRLLRNYFKSFFNRVQQIKAQANDRKASWI